MSVRANWHLGDAIVEAPEGDPLQTRQTRIEDVARPMPLGQHVQLERRLVALVNSEGQLATEGTTCPIKDRPDTACSACPIRRSDPLDPKTRLCAVGCEQERILTRLAVERERDAVQRP